MPGLGESTTQKHTGEEGLPEITLKYEECKIAGNLAKSEHYVEQ